MLRLALHEARCTPLPLLLGAQASRASPEGGGATITGLRRAMQAGGLSANCDRDKI